MSAKERYVTDEHGSRTDVLLDLDYYEKLLEAAEELESTRMYDEAKESGDDAIPFAQAVREIESNR